MESFRESQMVWRTIDDPAWKWSELSGITTTITDPKKVWDGQYDPYFSMLTGESKITGDYATWKMKGVGGYEYRRLRSEFQKPEKHYDYVHLLSDNQEAFSGSGAPISINNEIGVKKFLLRSF